MKSQELLRKFAMVAIVVITVSIGNGCAAISQHMAGISNAFLIHANQRHDLAAIRRDTREALAEQEGEALRIAAERDVTEARLAAERQRLEIEFCQANQERLQQRIKENIRQTVESRVAFNLEHGMEVGELEVDVEELKQLIEQREQEIPTQPLQEQPVKQPCACCDRPCGCEPGLTRRHCPRCRHKPCEAEKKCGGEEMLTQLQQQPVKRPLRPAEIPMKLPVRLTFGFQQPELETSRIRRIPNIPEQPFLQPCDRCGHRECQCNPPCVGHSQPATNETPATGKNGNAGKVPPPIPPPPVPDLEAMKTSNGQSSWPIEVDSKTTTGSLSNRRPQNTPVKPAAMRR